MGYLERVEKKTKKRETNGLRRSTFIANVFHGNMELFKQAMDEGEIAIKTDDGEEYYTVESIGTRHEKGTEEKESITGVRLGGCILENILESFVHACWGLHPREYPREFRACMTLSLSIF